MKGWTSMRTRVETVAELFHFLWSHKLWWLIPMTVTLLLLSLLIVLGHNPVLAPFIYTLF